LIRTNLKKYILYYIEIAEKHLLYNYSVAVISKVNLSSKPNEFCDSGQMMIMSNHNQHHLITFALSSSGSCNPVTTAKLNLIIIV